MSQKRRRIQIHLYSKDTNKPEYHSISIRIIGWWLLGLVIIIFSFVFWLPGNMVNLKNFRVLEISKEQRVMQVAASKLEKQITEANSQIESGRNLRDKTNQLAGFSSDTEKFEKISAAENNKEKKITADFDRIKKSLETFRKMRDTLLANGPYAQSLPLLHPVKQHQNITNKFGLVRDPLTKRELPHRGLDFAIREGDTVIATGDGIVEGIVNYRSGSGFGITLEIQHTPHVKTLYSHLHSVLVQSGKPVKKGQAIALAGKSGSVLWPVLHYEVRYDNQPVNPEDYFITP